LQSGWQPALREFGVRIDIVSIACNSGESIMRLSESAVSRHDVRFRVFLHSRHAATVQACEQLAAQPNVAYYAYGTNRGISKSWNEGMLEAYGSGADSVIIVNDDVVFSPFDVDRLAEKAVANPDRYIVSCAGYHVRLGRSLPSHGYSCFAINPIALRHLGCFDENFFPAYCEDQDYAYRAQLAGLSEENCPDTRVFHFGSATISSDPILRRQNAYTHLQNMQYYRSKWGGDGGNEIYVQPFNDSSWSYYVAPHQRHAPYGAGRDRVRHELART
jgi:GT2 family glycosyltransferase